MATQHAQQSSSTDLGRLWTQAIKDYKARTGEDLSAMGAQNMAEVMKSTDAGMKRFKGFRDDGSKMSRFRSSIGNHLGDIQKCIDGMAMVGAAAGAFPPAMPVGLVFTAASRLISAFAGVKADYDRVESFFAYSARFFERLSILESRADSGPLMIAIVRVFSMQLSVCARVQFLIKEKRFSQWLNALWNMEDQELVAAYAAMQASIDELDQAVGFESYSHIRAVQDDVRTNNNKLSAVQEEVSASNAKLDDLDEKIRSFRADLGQDVQQLYASSLKLEVVITNGFVAVQTKQDESHALLVQILKNQDKSSKVSGLEEKKKKNQNSNQKGDVGDRKFQALRQIKKFFNDNHSVFPSWADAQSMNMAQDEDMRESQVKHTAEWLSNHPDFKAWAEGQKPLLWLRGAEGIGKSFLAHSAVQKLRGCQDEHDSLAYFYFKEEHPYQQSMQNAFASVALQIAESSNKYAEQVAAKLKEDSEDADEISTWKRFFLSMFPGDDKSDDRLFIVFDGLDEAHVKEGGILTQFLSDLKLEKANVSVLATSRPDEKPTLQRLEPSIIEITKQEVKSDIKTLVKSRLTTLPRVRKFSHAVKRAITRQLVKQADSMLYVEHMLRRFSYIGRERAVMEDLTKLPSNLSELYQLLLEECRRNRSEAQYEAMKKMFAWLAFSKRSLSLAEASSLVQLTLSDDTFDIEEEIIGRSSRILEITQSRQTDEDGKDEDNDEDDNDDTKEDQVPELEYRNSPLSFQDRSLREYFKSVSVEAEGTTEFRTPAVAAHLTILQMCADIMLKVAKDVEDPANTELAQYAIQYWYEHLKELNPDTAKDDAVRQVLNILFSITANTNNVAKLFEIRARHTEMYPERSDDAPPAWFDILLTWAAKASSLPDEFLGDDVRKWSLNVNKDNVLLPLADGHVQNWLVANDQWWIPETFRFVRAALSLAQKFQATEGEPLKDILAITTQYALPLEECKVLRAVGATLCDYYYDDPNPDREKTVMDEGVSYLKRAVECIEGEPLDQIATISLLVQSIQNCQWLDENSECIKYYDQANALLPDPDSEDLTAAKKAEVKSAQINLLTLKSGVYRNMKQPEDALKCLNEARKLSGDDPSPGWRLDDLTLLFNIEFDPDGTKLMETLKSWSKKERENWFAWCFESWVDDNAVTRMQRAARLTKETDLLLEWLTSLAKTLPAESYYLFNLKCAVASLYYPVLGDIEKGKTLRQEILAMKPKPESYLEETMNETKSRHRMQLADILFLDFQTSADPTKKEELMESFKRLPSAHANDDNIQESHVGMLRANMLRIMGPAKEYHKYMTELFKTCINGLEDGVSWNDSSSLRLLSKVLASLDGLERDARIANSAHFSILDRSIHDKDNASDDPETSEKASSEPDTQLEGTNNDDSVGESGQTTDVTETNGVPESLDSSTSNEANGEIRVTTEIQDAKEPVEADLTVPDPTTADTTASQPVAAESTIAQLPELDEDISGAGIFCDGGCGTIVSSWTESFYYCLVCPNCDLCEKCHAKRLAQTRGEIEEPWLSFCGKDHRYIKSPMKGWKGIKNGVIRIGEEEVAVTEWLKGLKEERWPKAWEMFWTRQSGLKDIGFED
ncbi:hypothetical protein DE146DRAFT_793188 [Phaeosphaeria sp. MPI-PUGE-AT-0046c]|nr:hypothetical protein DE146DRAFT_793188 [Phaeosphaeria sp. MPI-PUGE-AT-0046c]